jgi:hypothetical protein
MRSVKSWLYAYRVTLLIDVLAIEDGDGAILPTWTAVDSNNVRTSRELWEYTRSQGWNVEVSTSLWTIINAQNKVDQYHRWVCSRLGD